VGGLLVSQALTLFTTPVIYIYLDRLSNWLSRGRTGRATASADEADGVEKDWGEERPQAAE
jgi:HAE1 family hydrophobic/amphiphilic exporter-1